MTDRGFDENALLSPEQALELFFGRVNLIPPRREHVVLEEALGRVLAEPILADEDYPNAPRSAMDGFAILASSTPGRLRIAGDVAMGEAAIALRAGEALRIPTGGVVPDGADAVVPLEDVAVENDAIVVSKAVAVHDSVIDKGADMRAGDLVLAHGRRLGPAQLGLLATLGVIDVPVFRRPVIGVISSGDELVDPALRPAPGEVRDSNRFAIAASLTAMGAQTVHYPTVSDEPGALEAAMTAALKACDAVVLSGGSSVGGRDRSPAAVESLGEPGVIVHGLRVKPGKPTLLGALGQKPIIGLPGNPTSALMILEAVVAPVIGALTGAAACESLVPARLAEPARSRLGWIWYLPVSLRDEAGTYAAHPLPLRSFSVSLPARADGYVVIGERDEMLPAGELVTVHRFLGS
jgi:molybdopterin molybdotransferase